jgi:hypothetical protein
MTHARTHVRTRVECVPKGRANGVLVGPRREVPAAVVLVPHPKRLHAVPLKIRVGLVQSEAGGRREPVPDALRDGLKDFVVRDQNQMHLAFAGAPDDGT